MSARPPAQLLDIALPLIVRVLVRLVRGQSAAHLLSNLEAVLREWEHEP
jgi:hypothetical protein